MRIERLALQEFEGPIVEGITSQRHVLPSFIASGQRNVEPPPPPPPTFSEEQLKAAEQEGYRKGFLDGEKEGRGQVESEHARVNEKLTELVAQLAGQIGGMIAKHNAYVASQQEDVSRLVLAVARKVAGASLDVNPLPAIEAIVLPCITRMLGEPHIVVTVNDTLAAALEDRLIAHFMNSSEPGEISIQGDATMAIGDCRIDWGKGMAERDTAALWQDIERIMGVQLAGKRGLATPNTQEPVLEAVAEAVEPAASPAPEGDKPENTDIPNEPTGA